METNTFYIEDATWNKIIGYARTAYDMLSTEVGGMAIVKKTENDRWVISDATILKQEVTSTICHLDQEELANCILKWLLNTLKIWKVKILCIVGGTLIIQWEQV